MGTSGASPFWLTALLTVFSRIIYAPASVFFPLTDHCEVNSTPLSDYFLVYPFGQIGLAAVTDLVLLPFTQVMVLSVALPDLATVPVAAGALEEPVVAGALTVEGL